MKGITIKSLLAPRTMKRVLVLVYMNYLNFVLTGLEAGASAGEQRTGDVRSRERAFPGGQRFEKKRKRRRGWIEWNRHSDAR